jgi:hypothetical protein
LVDTVIGIPGSRSHIVTLRPPEGGTGLELSSFVRPDHEPGSPTVMANEVGLRNVSFEVDDLQATVDGLAADGYGLVGGIGQYENIWRTCAGQKGSSCPWLSGSADAPRLAARRAVWFADLARSGERPALRGREGAGAPQRGQHGRGLGERPSRREGQRRLVDEFRPGPRSLAVRHRPARHDRSGGPDCTTRTIPAFLSFRRPHGGHSRARAIPAWSS